MKVYFKTPKELNSEKSIINEEFGILYETSHFKAAYALGTNTSISSNSWKVQALTLQQTTIPALHKIESIHSKFIIFNNSQTNFINLKEQGKEQITIQPQQGIFYNSINSKYLSINQTTINSTIIELKENYFDQGMFHPTLKQNMNKIFTKNDQVRFDLSDELSVIINTIFLPSKRGLCQFMFLNAKIFEVLSAVSDKLDVNSMAYYTHPFQKQLDLVKKVIDSQLHIHYSINELAKIAGLNTSYLKKYFKEVFEETIFEYASHKRINYAKELLLTSSEPIASIAEKIGYQQPAHFSHAFKNTTGFTPNQYRKKNNSTIIPQ